jgi:hypothetical protein
VASANFIGALILPNEPNTTPPTIVVHSPIQNQTCNSTDLWLNFTVIKPERFFGNVTSAWYIVDGGEPQNIDVHDRFINDSGSIFLPIRELNFSSNIKLTVGAHNVKIGIEAQSFYIDYVDGQGWIYPSVLVHAESETVSFTVHVPEPVPVAAAVAVVAVAACAGLLLYFKKRGHEAGQA